MPAGTYVVDAAATSLSGTLGNVVCRIGSGNTDAVLTMPVNQWVRLVDVRQLVLATATTVALTCVTNTGAAVTYGQVHVVATKIG